MKLPLALSVAGAIAVSIVVIFLLTMKEHEDQVVALHTEQIRALSELISEHLVVAMATDSYQNADIESEIRMLAANKNLLCGHVLDGRKQILANAFFQADVSSFLSAHTLESFLKLPTGIYERQGKLIAVDDIGDPALGLGSVVLISDLALYVETSRGAMLKHILPYVIGITLLAIIATICLLSRFLRPLQTLSLFTQQIGQSKDYTLRFRNKYKYEIGELGKRINSFLDTIEVELTINQEQNATLVEQQQTMMRLANYDSLTGLPNRQFVVDNLRLELARVRRTDDDLALVFFDLDGFKGINDSLGHETGDLILIEVADRVVNLLREGDLVARLGGDEFLVIPDREVSATSLNNLASRLVQAFSEPFMLRGLALKVGVSVGIAKASDADYELSQLMSNADLAMYRSKAKGRGTYTLFTVDMVESYKRKMSIANSIDSAIRSDEFLVYYQPKIDRNGKIIGLEALLRWQHPEFGLVMPSEFIPIAEQGGKISAITQWMLERVCMELPDLQMLLEHKFKIAVNLSGHDLRHTALFDDIYELFERYQVNPDYFEFEVTESAYLQNFAIADKFFKRLTNLGCTVALDDFGTGYSSLSYLTRITIDTLKIDRQFIREIESSERSRLVTCTIIDLAKRLSLTVCAEGIEQSSQWQYLNDHGCDHVQGFLFSKPIPLAELLYISQDFSELLHPPLADGDEKDA
ncbi:putative bifunctional diguanylate cyclase/phosphodiesterase [Alteromonas sp. 14N.309.X.WAT.G.H12]|uniref:putative bifunctional diguanylate cyclase/phosphodiesterase n=1 Tax=Alteromonas sp. 14N.309.X.WAT.G.H12 TaxID=3120824 RepID=UPI002FD3FDD1